MDAIGADGLTNVQWIESSRPGSSPNKADEFRRQNRVSANSTSIKGVGNQQNSGDASDNYSNFWDGFIGKILDDIGDFGEYSGKFNALKNGSIRIDYSYGVGDGYGNVLNTDVIGVLTTNRISSAPTVKSDKFHFVYGPGNWQQAAVINLQYKLITSWGNATLKIPKALFFGLPKEVKNGNIISKSDAARIATFSVNSGFALLVQTWKAEPDLSYSQLQSLWITNMQAIMATNGGTVGVKSAIGYMSPIIDASPED